MNEKDNKKNEQNNKVTRRSLFDWLGKAAVIALGSDLLAASCEEAGDKEEGEGESRESDQSQRQDSETGTETEDTGSSENKREGTDSSGTNGSGTDTDCSDAEPLDFEPGAKKGELLGNWPVRTVDEQDLSAILKTWELKVDGMVEQPMTFTFSDLLKLPRVDQVTDFHCVEGWSVLDVPWNGVHLKSLFDLVKPTAAATHVTFHTVGDTYNESLPLEVALEPKTLLAYGIDCATLPLPHGFPTRLVVPRLLAYKNPKYVYKIELTDKPIEGFWVAAGYSYEGEVPKSRLRDGKY